MKGEIKIKHLSSVTTTGKLIITVSFIIITLSLIHYLWGEYLDEATTMGKLTITMSFIIIALSLIHYLWGEYLDEATTMGRLTITIAFIIIALSPIHYLWDERDIRYTSEHFIELLSKGELGKAGDISGGEVKFQLSNVEGISKAEVLDTDIDVLDSSKNWARVNIKVDCLLCDGSYDVDWYTADLYKDKGWKVTRFKSSYPIKMNGLTKGHEEEKFNRIFSDYYKLLLAGQNDLATKKYLAGPARNEQEKNRKRLDFKYNIKDVKTNILFDSRDYTVVDVEYTLGKRAVNNAVHFYNTKEGWKIIDIVSK